MNYSFLAVPCTPETMPRGGFVVVISNALGNPSSDILQNMSQEIQRTNRGFTMIPLGQGVWKVRPGQEGLSHPLTMRVSST